MKKRKEFDNILDECFERLIKGETIEQCLASYPEQAAELEPLLQTAQVTKKATAVEPRPELNITSSRSSSETNVVVLEYARETE